MSVICDHCSKKIISGNDAFAVLPVGYGYAVCSGQGVSSIYCSECYNEFYKKYSGHFEPSLANEIAIQYLKDTKRSF